MGYSNLLAEDKKLVTYRPRLNEITGSVTATVLLQQIIFHADNVGNRPFYKFRAPCEHKLYREGDSWTEELGFSPAEFDTARSRIATRIMKGDSKTEILEGEFANHLVIYWTDANRVTWYMLNVDLLNRMLEKLYANSRNSNYQESEESPNSVIQDSEITRKLENPELPLSETTTEIPTEDTEKTLEDFLFFHEQGKAVSSKSHHPKADPLMLDEERRTAAARAEAGGITTVSVSEGGAFALGDILITAACARLGRSEPQGDKRKGALAFFKKALKAEGLLQGDPDMLIRAVRDWLNPKGEYAFFLPQYELTPKHELALRHFGIVLSKTKKVAAEAAASRAHTEAGNEASQAAFNERMEGKPPPKLPKERDAWDKALMQLQDHPQMGRRFFDEYLRGTHLLRQDDGVLIVGVASEEVKDFIEGRLLKLVNTVIGVGLEGYPKEVRFEVDS